MSRSASPPSPNRYPVIPPLATDTDRLFFRELQEYINDEMKGIDHDDRKQRFIILNSAFSMLIDHAHAYKPLLTRIKQEYESVIDAIERGKMEASYLNDRIQSMTNEPSTLRNYRRRCDELAKRIAVIKADNERLMQEIRELRDAKRSEEENAQRQLQVTRAKPKKDSRQIPATKNQHTKTKFVPGLTLEESTDVNTLQRELNRVENLIKDLSVNKKSKFIERDQKEDLKDKLAKKVAERDILQQRNSWLIAKQKRLKVAHDAALTYMNCKEPQYRTIADVIIMALSKSHRVQDDLKLQVVRDASAAHLEDDDPTREKEAEMVLEYIEKFNELFEEGRYEEAAIHAANSPKGILRTMETMARFKTVYAKKEGRSPWLAFCDALMSSVLALGVKPSDTMSIECVKCALQENRLDLLSHWIAQDRLTVTEKLGDMIADHCKGKNRTYLDMAESIFRSCFAHRKVVTVMLRQGLIKRGLDYAKGKEFTNAEYLDILMKYPSYQLGYALADLRDDSGKCVIPIGSICSALMEGDSHEIALQVLQKLFLVGPDETGSETNGLRLAVANDNITGSHQWSEIIKASNDYGYEEVSVELLAAVTVNRAMNLAREVSGLSEMTSSELNFSSATSSRLNQAPASATQ